MKDLCSCLCDFGSRAAVKGVVDDHGCDARDNTESIDNEDAQEIGHEPAPDAEGNGQEQQLNDEPAGESLETDPVDLTTVLLDSSEGKEKRTLVRQVIHSVGTPLIEAKGPKQLMDAMFGILCGELFLQA